MKIENKERAMYLMKVLAGTEEMLAGLGKAILNGARTDGQAQVRISCKGELETNLWPHGTNMDYAFLDMSMAALKEHHAKVTAELETL